MTIKPVRARCTTCNEALRCKSAVLARIISFGKITGFYVSDRTHETSTRLTPVFEGTCPSCLGDIASYNAKVKNKRTKARENKRKQSAKANEAKS